MKLLTIISHYFRWRPLLIYVSFTISTRNRRTSLGFEKVALQCTLLFGTYLGHSSFHSVKHRRGSSCTCFAWKWLYLCIFGKSGLLVYHTLSYCQVLSWLSARQSCQEYISCIAKDYSLQHFGRNYMIIWMFKISGWKMNF